MFNRIFNYLNFTIILIALILALILTSNKPVVSQSIRGLNSEISSLRSRINRLESEVRNIRSSNSAPGIPKQNFTREPVSDRINNPPVVDGRAIGNSDPMFEKLATLLIELKEDVKDIENRLVVLEKKLD